MRELAEQDNVGFLDLQAVWGQYVADSGQDVTWFMRDVVHANPKGEQILGRILERYFAPDGARI